MISLTHRDIAGVDSPFINLCNNALSCRLKPQLGSTSTANMVQAATTKRKRPSLISIVSDGPVCCFCVVPRNSETKVYCEEEPKSTTAAARGTVDASSPIYFFGLDSGGTNPATR